MKSILIAIFILIGTVSAKNTTISSQSYKSGEYLKFRLHYGLLNAGYATLDVSEKTYAGTPHYYVKGKGWTTGAVKVFFNVDDTYETYINKNTKLPSKFIRNINEGGHTKNKELKFNHTNNTVTVNDKKHKKVSIYKTESQIQDMLSSFYYLRNYNTDNLKTGDFININIFMDEENYKFKLKLLGRESKNTEWGNVSCLKVRPYVQSGRVFKAEESVTVWVTDDANKIPIQIKAELAVGSLKADLHSYKNLVTPIKFK